MWSKTVRGNDEVGTLQIRSRDADKLLVAATVLTTNNPAGTFGNTIPVFRSDRSAERMNRSFSPSAERRPTHTNSTFRKLPALRRRFKSNFGPPMDRRSLAAGQIEPFKLLAVVNVVRPTSSRLITNTSSGGGRIAAYATPVDEISNDTWAIADWSSQLAYAPTGAVIIPVAGSVHGANGTFFRTDVAFTNRGTSTASGTLRYFSRTGDRVTRQITPEAGNRTSRTNVIGARMA